MSDRIRRPRLGHLRTVALALLVLASLSLASSYATERTSADDWNGESPLDRTVVATIDGTGPGQIVAYGPDGSVVYRNDSLLLYHDVDPGPGGEQTVEYVASDDVGDHRCGGDACLRNVVRRVNLTTGEGTTVHEWVHRRNGSTQTHDVDRVNESVLLVADISYPDRVFMLNTTTDEVIWEWRVSEAYEPKSGGDYPSDWSHLNDAEYLPDGRVMVSLRNQDQVVFVDPGEGLQEEWTLGADGDHEVLYEQHNPDYVPESRGGPAVIVADSENNRVVEYQRVNDSETSDASRASAEESDGSWERSWVWRDDDLQWPRDADRLPNGNTVLVDSHGERVLSVAPNGTVAWSRQFPDGGYDAEVLGTGDESAGGASATGAGLQSQSPTAGPADPAFLVVSLFPQIVVHGLLYALPAWTTPLDAVLVLAAAVVSGTWLLVTGGRALGRRWRGS